MAIELEAVALIGSGKIEVVPAAVPASQRYSYYITPPTQRYSAVNPPHQLPRTDEL